MSHDDPDLDPRDPLLTALRALPPKPSDDPSDAERDARHRYAARAAYVRAFEKDTWHAPLGRAGRFVMPVVLAGVVGLYLTWAITAATALVR